MNSARLVTLEGECYAGDNDILDFSDELGIDVNDFELLAGGPEGLSPEDEDYLRDKYMGFIPLVAAVGAANTLRKSGIGKGIGKLFRKISFRRKKKKKKSAPVIVPKAVTRVGVPVAPAVPKKGSIVEIPSPATVKGASLVPITKVPKAYLIGGGVLAALLLLRR